MAKDKQSQKSLRNNKSNSENNGKIPKTHTISKPKPSKKPLDSKPKAKLETDQSATALKALSIEDKKSVEDEGFTARTIINIPEESTTTIPNFRNLDKREKNNFQLYYDDSSDEEEDENILRENGIEWFEDTLSKLKSLQLNFNSSIPLIDLQLSFLAHEFGIRILRSSEVNDLYYPLKKEQLKGSKTLSIPEVKECIVSALNNSLSNTYPQEAKKLKESNEESLTRFSDYVEQNPRTVIKAVNSQNLKPFWNKELKLNLPLQKSVHNNESLIKLVKEVYANCGVEATSNIIYNKTAKTKLDQYKPGTNIKKLIREKLLEQNKTVSIKNFVNDNIVDFQRAQDSKIQTFYDSLESHIYNSIENKSKNNVERTTLPSLYNIPLDQEYSIVKFLAHLRLVSKSDIRSIKNFKNYENFISDQEILIRSYNYSPDIFVTAKHTIFKGSGSKSEELNIGKVGNSTSYLSVISMINNLKSYSQNSINDSKLASSVMDMLKNGETKKLDNFTTLHFEQKQATQFVASLTCLLFSTEVARNPASLIIHYMMLELIEKGKLSWEDGLKKVAMTLEGAVPASRWEHLNYKTSLKYNYDKSLEQVLNPNEASLQTFITHEAQIFKQWLKLKYIFITTENDFTNDGNFLKSLEVLEKHCEEWYKIKLEIKQNMVADLLFDIASKDFDLEPFSISDAITLKDIIDWHEKSLKTLLEISTDEEDILKIIKFYCKNDTSDEDEISENENFKNFSNPDIIWVIDDEKLSVEEAFELIKYGVRIHDRDYREYKHEYSRGYSETYLEWLHEKYESSSLGSNSSASSDSSQEN